ncbi:hypothetical protein GIB67_000914 [Kingdonia uniflora]|uniref:RING-type E3 ubiquitin transferase n=1 Tax=Kingdonia uniflora TaxID=39325 RepID=A0A7J7MFM9_9MAGN|nr:hypothetical protein GIB67_000914 [Kingdonia uniflora]
MSTATTEFIINLTLILASDLLSQLVQMIYEIGRTASDVLFEEKSVSKLSDYLQRIVPVLKEMIEKSNTQKWESLDIVIQILDREIRASKKLVMDCTKRNKVYLLVKCRKIARQAEGMTREISKALGLLSVASLELSIGINEEIERLCDDMMKAEFKATIAEERILERIESGIQERNVERAYANELLHLIAEAIGISTERKTMKKEFEDFKNEIEDVQLQKDKAEAIQMDQIIALLGRADATSSSKEKEIRYFSKRNSLGTQPLEPLQPFCCPITRDVMVDPVETSSGQTFERSAIEKWFSEGNYLCPLTMTPLNPEILRPNKTLRQSIEEWKDRNTMITIASLKPTLRLDDEQEVLRSLGQLQGICEERDLHREWVALEKYIPEFIKLLASKSRDIRNHALELLCILAKDSDDCKERIAEVDNSIESIVRSLARRVGESNLAATLLLELSKSDIVRDRIGIVQGCILLLVTMTSGNDSEAANDAKDLLENLSFRDHNVIQMARANYFKPLLQRLSSGTEETKLIMATTLAEMQLTDDNKSLLFENGVLKPLLHLVCHSDTELKKVAIRALQKLSSLPQNGLQMIKEGAVPPLLKLLYHHSSSSTCLREQAAGTLMNIALSTSLSDAVELQVSLLEDDEDIFNLFSLINLTGPEVQQSILRTFHAMCQSSSAADIRSKLRQCSAVQLLIQLCELDNIAVRANAVKLFYCLAKDSDNATLLEHVDQKCIATLLKILGTSEEEEEISATLGIISILPKEPTQITQWLIDAEALPLISKFLTYKNHHNVHTTDIIDNAVGAICRFSISTSQVFQKKASEAGIIPVLVELLGSGSSLTKKHAAFSLAEFSRSSIMLCEPVEIRRGFWCWSKPQETGCPVHMGICSIESSYCLVEADAVGPLVRVLGDTDLEACEAALDALLTLIHEERLQSGSKFLSNANAVAPIVKLLSSPSVNVQEKALRSVERIFRLLEIKQKYGHLAQMPLVVITQSGNSTTKPLAARILAQLGVLHEESSYF